MAGRRPETASCGEKGARNGLPCRDRMRLVTAKFRAISSRTHSPALQTCKVEGSILKTALFAAVPLLRDALWAAFLEGSCWAAIERKRVALIRDRIACFGRVCRLAIASSRSCSSGFLWF